MSTATLPSRSRQGMLAPMRGWPKMLVDALTKVHKDPGPPTKDEEVAVSFAAFQEGLKKMFQPDRHFCIIDYADMYEQRHGVGLPSTIRKKLGVFHCIKWADMEENTRQDLQEYIIRLLQTDGDLACPRV